MSVRPGQSWQTALTDLSLVLFMITAGAVSQQQAKPHKQTPPKVQAPATPSPSPQTEPLSVYIAAPGAPPLTAWLDQQAADPRQQLTITARYGSTPGEQARALVEAGKLLAQAGAQGRSARIVVEPGEGPVRAALAYDVPGGAQSGAKVAQDVH